MGGIGGAGWNIDNQLAFIIFLILILLILGIN
jgi:hypothetical protein